MAEAHGRRCGEPHPAGSEHCGRANRQAHCRHRDRYRHKADGQDAGDPWQPGAASGVAGGCGRSTGEVDIVINTHLHFDHCGWNTTLHADGSVTPTFPNARYFAHRGEMQHGHPQLERDRVSYLSPNYDPLVHSGQMTLLDDERVQSDPEICAGTSVELFPGHTEHLLGVHIESAGEHACYIIDLIPASAHLDPTWVMSYDLDPLECIARKRFYERAIPEQWLVLFTHDHHRPMARIKLDDRSKPIVTEP